MSDDDQMIGDDVSEEDIFDREPTKLERIEMRKARKPPSEWLRLLCKDWAAENEVLVETADAKFLDYKPYLKGLLTPQLLYRLTVPIAKDTMDGINHDFWSILGVSDEFDRSYIVAQVERFCALYNVRGTVIDDDPIFSHDISSSDPASLAAAAAAGINVSPGSALNLNFDANAAAAVAAAALPVDLSKIAGKQLFESSQNEGQDISKALESESSQNAKEDESHQQDMKEKKARDRQQLALQKAAERAEREAEREARRLKKLHIRQQREKFIQEQKAAALKRAAELVASNRVPIEITRGSQAVRSMAARNSRRSQNDYEGMKKRSAIVVSTAADLHAIVTHSKNLWAKYNAIAKEHNQKVNWNTVAKELGINVKVREKYARMHSRAEQRGFDWEAHGNWKIKDHPEIFLEPTYAEQRARMPSPLHTSPTVLIENNKEVTDEAVALAAAVVDASVSAPHVDPAVPITDEHHGTAAALAATSLVSDPTAGLEDINQAQV